ncbi:MAG TPA: Mur ligase family protein, partial [bacterium]|nr:Mur ligase family protein [bacterium]
VEWGVLEVGMGGRYDAARAMAQDVTVFTPIGFDHMQFLGNTLEAIATEKAQIMRPGSLAICCPDQRPEVVTVLGHHAMKVGAALEVMSNLGFNWMFRGVPADPGFDYHHGGWRVDDLTPGLRGRYQAANAATALFTVQAMVGRGLLPRLPTDMEARSAIASVTQRLHPGRYEVLCNEPPIWCEGGHNPMALRTFVFNLTPLVGGRNGHLLLAFKADKDITEAVAQLAPLQPATVTCTQYLQHQPCPPEEVAAAVRANLPEATVLVEPDLRGALQGVANRCAADPRGAYGLVIGSLYLAGDVRNLIMAGEVPGVPWRLAGQGPGD